MSENTEKAKTIVDRIRKLLFNYDLSIAYGKSEIHRRSIEMELYEGKQGNAYKKFVAAKVEKERFELYVDEMENAKKELLENFNLITDKYIGKYRQVFVAYFIENKSYEEIAEITSYSFEAIKWIIRKLKRELLDLFIV